MQNCKIINGQMHFVIRDPLSDKSYDIPVSSIEELIQLQTDQNYAEIRLIEAKDHAIARLIHDAELLTNETANISSSVNHAESLDEMDPELMNIDDGSEEPEAVQKAPGFKWPRAAIDLLLSAIAERQAEFNSISTTQVKIWHNISEELRSKGYDVSGPQCRSKYAGLKRTYKATRDKNSKSGNSPTHWVHFKQLDEMMGDKPYMSPLAIFSGRRSRSVASTVSDDEDDSSRSQCSTPDGSSARSRRTTKSGVPTPFQDMMLRKVDDINAATGEHLRDLRDIQRDNASIFNRLVTIFESRLT